MKIYEVRMPNNNDPVFDTIKLLIRGAPVIVIDGKEDRLCFRIRTHNQDNDSENVFFDAVVSPKKSNINLNDALASIIPAYFYRHGGNAYVAMVDHGDDFVTGIYLVKMSESDGKKSAYFQKYQNKNGFIRCENLTGFLKIIFYHPNINLIILPYEDFSLRRYIDQKIKNQMKPNAQEIKKIMIKLIDTLSQLHKNGMNCGALTLDSVVFYGREWLITDLSLSKKIGDAGPNELDFLTEYTCPLAYCEPKKYATNTEVDIYALGVILKKLLLNQNIDCYDFHVLRKAKTEEYCHAKNKKFSRNQALVNFFSPSDFSDIKTLVELKKDKSQLARKLDKIFHIKKISKKFHDVIMGESNSEFVLFSINEMDLLKQFLKSESPELHQILLNLIELDRLMKLAYAMIDPDPIKRPALDKLKNDILSFGAVRSFFYHFSKYFCFSSHHKTDKINQVLPAFNPLNASDELFSSSSESDSDSVMEEMTRSQGSVILDVDDLHPTLTPNPSGFFSPKSMSYNSSLGGGISLETSVN